MPSLNKSTRMLTINGHAAAIGSKQKSKANQRPFGRAPKGATKATASSKPSKDSHEKESVSHQSDADDEDSDANSKEGDSNDNE